MDGFVVAEKNDRIASTSSFAMSSKRNESAVSSPNRLAAFKRSIYGGLSSFDTSTTNSNWKDSLLNSMEVMMNRLLKSHFDSHFDKVRALIDGFTNTLTAAAEDIKNDDAAAHSDTNIEK